MITCIIIDDESYAIDTLTDYISKTTELRLLASFSNPVEAISAIGTHIRPDLVFLDINMPGLSGLEVAGMLPEHTAIIYVTAHAEQAIKTFETNVYDFLLKPVSFAKFLKSVQKIKVMMDAKPLMPEVTNDYFFINPGVKGKMIKLEYKEIIYIQGLKNYVIIYIVGGKQITYLTMTEIERALPADRFLRIHKSFIINLNRIQSLEGNTVIMSEHLNLPLGGSYKETLMNFIVNKSVTSRR